jgi:hypothetical protein
MFNLAGMNPLKTIFEYYYNVTYSYERVNMHSVLLAMALQVRKLHLQYVSQDSSSK